MVGSRNVCSFFKTVKITTKRSLVGRFFDWWNNCFFIVFWWNNGGCIGQRSGSNCGTSHWVMAFSRGGVGKRAIKLVRWTVLIYLTGTCSTTSYCQKRSIVHNERENKGEIYHICKNRAKKRIYLCMKFKHYF